MKSSEGIGIVSIICPMCGKEGVFPIFELNEEGLTTFSVKKNMICIHTFQIFVDQKLGVRGYQKVQHEFDKKEKKMAERIKKKEKKEFENKIKGQKILKLMEEEKNKTIEDRLRENLGW